MQIGEVVADKTSQKAHQIRHFGRRPAPVLGRKAVDRQIAHAKADGGAHRDADRFDAAAMALEARQSARLRPTAVAVHDDADMRWRAERGGVAAGWNIRMRVDGRLGHKIAPARRA
jgi:hypothetical protein